MTLESDFTISNKLSAGDAMLKKNISYKKTHKKQVLQRKKKKEKRKINHTVKEITHGLLQPQDNHPHVCRFKF